VHENAWRCIPGSLHVPFFMNDRARSSAISYIAIKFEKAVSLCPPMARNSNRYSLQLSANGKSLLVDDISKNAHFCCERERERKERNGSVGRQEREALSDDCVIA